MNPDIIEFLCKSHSFISGTPIKIFYDNKLQNSYGDYSYILDIDLTEPYYQQLINTDKLINYIVTPELLIIGMMKEKSSPITILVGPMCTGNMPENTVHKIITSGLYPLRLDQINALSEYLQMLPKLHIDHLISILCALYASINQELISVNEIIKPDAEYEIIADVDRNLLAEEEKTSFHGLQRRNPHEFEAEMMFCIKHGLTDQLCKLVGKSSLKQAGTLAYDTLRNYKNAIIILNSLSIRAAIAGGLSPETSYQLGEIYIRKIEACADLKQLGKISHTLRMDYCERVRELQYPHTGDILINKAMHFINENIYKKITATEIAESLSISKEYLSTRFKQVTRKTIPDYINHQKILEAKRLLHLTDKPLSEISEYLSYCTQSHFQNVFKKLTGMTPLEYRNRQEEVIV